MQLEELMRCTPENVMEVTEEGGVQASAMAPGTAARPRPTDNAMVCLLHTCAWIDRSIDLPAPSTIPCLPPCYLIAFSHLLCLNSQHHFHILPPPDHLRSNDIY